jgi:hypothetical protein
MVISDPSLVCQRTTRSGWWNGCILQYTLYIVYFYENHDHVHVHVNTEIEYNSVSILSLERVASENHVHLNHTSTLHT